MKTLGFALPLAPTEPIYTLTQRRLHWLTAALFITSIALVLAADAVDSTETMRSILGGHRTIGVLLLVTALVRLSLRLPAKLRRQRNSLVARVAHGLIYAALLGEPVLGLLQEVAKGKPVTFIGALQLPPLMAGNLALSETLAEVHELLGWSFVVLIGLHVTASLFHHFVLRDDTLYAMRPM